MLKEKHHISSKLHMIYISSNNVRHPVTKTFTTLHSTTLYSTSLRYTFHLHGLLVTRIYYRTQPTPHSLPTYCLAKKKHVILSLFVLRRFSLGYVGLIQFRVSKQTNQAPVNYIITCNLSVNDISFIYIHTV